MKRDNDPSSYLASTIKQKKHSFRGIILLHQLNITLVASPEQEMKRSPLFSGAPFPKKL